MKYPELNKYIPIVVIESPFRGNNYEDLERNIAYLRAAIRDCLLRGEAPFASHGLYTLPGVLDDKVPEERSLGIKAGFVFREVADLTAVYTDLGIFEGMQLGIDDAKTHNREIEYRTLPGWDANTVESNK